MEKNLPKCEKKIPVHLKVSIAHTSHQRLTQYILYYIYRQNCCKLNLVANTIILEILYEDCIQKIRICVSVHNMLTRKEK